jgi:hypothetical protein
MIPDQIIYRNNAGLQIELNEEFNFRYPLHEFEMPVYQEQSPQSKMQQPGEWPTFSYPRYRTFHLKGAILGTSPETYNDAVGDMKEVIQPPFTYYNARRHGTLFLRFFGDATVYHMDVTLVNLETPKEANYPSVGDYMIDWRGFEPYLRTSGNAVTLRY